MKNETGLFAGIARFYDGLVREHGHSHRACHYSNPDSQRAKFRVLSEVLPLDGKSVLDVGCGFADFADYLNSRFKGVRYSGIDISPQMVESAKRLHPSLDIRQANLLDLSGERFDVVTCNGIFYLLGPEAPSLMRSMIERMFAIASEAVAVNSLSAWAPDPHEGEYYADPVATAEFCRSLTPFLTLRHDYHTRDFTMYLYKERRP